MQETTCNVGDPGLIPGLGRTPGEGNGNLLQYSSVGSPMNRGAWWAIAHGVSRVRHNAVNTITPDAACVQGRAKGLGLKAGWGLVHHLERVVLGCAFVTCVVGGVPPGPPCSARLPPACREQLGGEGERTPPQELWTEEPRFWRNASSMHLTPDLPQ